MNESSLLGRLKVSPEALARHVVFGMEDGTVLFFDLLFAVAATANDKTTVLIAGASWCSSAHLRPYAPLFTGLRRGAEYCLARGAR
jgi:hypothetical protein